MTASTQQIVEAFEQLNLSIAELAEQFDTDEASVKAALYQFSVKFRKDEKKEIADGFTQEEELEARRVIVQLMKYSDDENVKARMAKYIRDDKKGRLDIGIGLKGLNIDINIWNNQLRKMRQAEQRTIELDSSDTKQLAEKT